MLRVARAVVVDLQRLLAVLADLDDLVGRGMLEGLALVVVVVVM